MGYMENGGEKRGKKKPIKEISGRAEKKIWSQEGFGAQE
jgi:hypothetical protein